MDFEILAVQWKFTYYKDFRSHVWACGHYFCICTTSTCHLKNTIDFHFYIGNLVQCALCV